MIVFPSMLVNAARAAGMPVPPDPDKFSKEDFPHFGVFCVVQLARPVSWGEHWENAEVVAKVPADKIKEITLDDLIERGLRYQSW